MNGTKILLCMPTHSGIIHAFAGSYEQAREYLRLGFRLGLGGAPTWPPRPDPRHTWPKAALSVEG